MRHRSGAVLRHQRAEHPARDPHPGADAAEPGRGRRAVSRSGRARSRAGRGVPQGPPRRTPTAGAFADALGGAYGLRGDHHGWASAQQDTLAAQLAEAPPLPLVVRRPSRPGSAPGAAATAAGGAVAITARSAAAALDSAPGASARLAPVREGTSLAAWLVAVLVVLAALGVGMLAAWLLYPR
jgi:hypothetical protein